MENLRFGSKVIHNGNTRDKGYNAVTLPIYQTSNFRFESVEEAGDMFAGRKAGFVYTTYGNPTVRLLEEKLADIEGAEDCAVTSSGMGAIGSAMLTLTAAGTHVIADKELFSDTFLLLSRILPRFGVEVDYIDLNDTELLKKTLKDNTVAIYFETPTNPTLKIVDIEKVAKTAHERNPKINVVVDNTFASFLQAPLTLGADVVVHSLTKYINGHGDTIGGCVCGSAEFVRRVRKETMQCVTGCNLAPNDAFLIIRGLQTFDLRIKKHVENANALAEYLDKNPKVTKVYYPGLPSHPLHDVAMKQMKGAGGMVSFEVATKDEGARLVAAMKMCVAAISLGDPATLIQHPASMTHSSYSEEELKNAGIPQGLIRVSVGLEETEDILDDFRQAFAQLD